jgi:hypothetical protein
MTKLPHATVGTSLSQQPDKGAPGRLFAAAPTPTGISAAFNRVIARQSFSDVQTAIIDIPLVMVESPYRGLTTAEAEGYAEAACWDCMERGEAPFASHLLYTRFLDDKDPKQRELGMIFGRAWIKIADLMAVYEDLGISAGMKTAMELAEKLQVDIQIRKIGK